MRTIRMLSALTLAGFVLFAAVPEKPRAAVSRRRPPRRRRRTLPGTRRGSAQRTPPRRGQEGRSA